jgi:catalase (peroxidase I)
MKTNARSRENVRTATGGPNSWIFTFSISPTLSNPVGKAFDYAKEFENLDLYGIIKDLHALLTDSQD